MQKKTGLADLTSDSPAVRTAYAWLGQRRIGFPANADIWHFSFHQATLVPQILDKISRGQYQFSPMQVVNRQQGDALALWGAEDAFVLKIITLTLQTVLPLHPRCKHIKGHGGHKSAVNLAHQWLQSGDVPFVCKTDIKGYYASINKTHLFSLLAGVVDDLIMCDLLAQFLEYSVEQGENFHTPERGIPRGCPLSPLLAGFHLYALDKALSERKGIRYCRFMDDLLIRSRTRWQLKKAVAIMNQWFTEASLEQHPDKTFIGRIQRGFDWLGYQYDARGLCAIAPRALANHHLKIQRLFEQARCQSVHQKAQIEQRMLDYITRWQRWVTAGIDPEFDVLAAKKGTPVTDPGTG